MAEQSEELELEDRGMKNKEDDRLERIGQEVVVAVIVVVFVLEFEMVYSTFIDIMLTETLMCCLALRNTEEQYRQKN